MSLSSECTAGYLDGKVLVWLQKLCSMSANWSA